MGAERTGGGCHQRRMERSGYRQPNNGTALGLESNLSLFDGGHGTGKDGLGGAVAVGNRDVHAPLCEHGLRLVGPATDGEHGTGGAGGLGHQFAPLTGNADHGVEVGAAGGIEGRDFAEAVPANAIGAHAQSAQNVQDGDACSADGRLRPFGLLQRGGLGLAGFVRINGLGENRFAQPWSAVPGGAGFLERHGEVAGHSNVLATLAREKECRRA